MNEVMKVYANNEIIESSTAREMQRVQAQVILSKKFPRNKLDSIEKINQACSSKELAEVAMYQYPRGGQSISGPSIRLAEVIAQAWGNLDYGIVELSQKDGESVFQAFAWDMESNVRSERTFTVKHERYSKNGTKKLIDPRDIYEIVANNGARRLRACILSIIPRDVVEKAEKAVNATMKANVDVTKEGIEKMVSIFDVDFQVSKDDIEKFLGCRLHDMQPAMMLRLRRVYSSLKDGFSGVEDYFKRDEKKPNNETIGKKLTPDPEKKPEDKKKKEEKKTEQKGLDF